jgi:AMMECR1 domain-containing protein
MIPKGEQKLLINLAREAISSNFSGIKLTIPENIKQKFHQKQGVFVTLKKQNN